MDGTELMRRFVDGLHTLERTEDVEPLAALYADGADVGNVVVGEKYHGPDGAREFWRRYRGTFRTIESRFHREFATDRNAALEWTSEGTLADGSPFVYDGVTLLDFEGEKLKGSRAYFNPRALGTHTS